jgi:TonB family protein
VESGTEGAPNYGPGGGTGDGKISYELGGRKAQSLPHPKYDIQKEGKVVVEVTVNQSGVVTKAVAGVKGSTTLDDNLLRVAREAALKATFDSNPDAPAIQIGTITYNFKLN